MKSYEKTSAQVSVIVPVYNAELYIKKCINSIQKQTYSELEIVIIDDGSKDGSVAICDQIAKEDSRIRVIKKENGGVVSARKAGVEAAGGEFICWVDADDWIEPDMVEGFVRLQQDSGADIVTVAHYHDIGENSVLVRNGLANGVYSAEDVVSTMLYTGNFYEYGIGPYLWTKMFRASILKETQKKVPGFIVAGDDAAVVYPSLLKADKICVSDVAGYHYMQNPGSITKTRYASEKERIEKIVEFLREEFIREGVYKETENQLNVYRNYLLALRDIRLFDDGNKKLLVPFGGVKKDARVVIYGAGVLGQQIFTYLHEQTEVSVVAWIDRNYEIYCDRGFPVCGPEKLQKIEGEYDCLLIANITGSVAEKIRETLLDTGVPETKIFWFTEEFRGVGKDIY